MKDGWKQVNVLIMQRQNSSKGLKQLHLIKGPDTCLDVCVSVCANAFKENTCTLPKAFLC